MTNPPSRFLDEIPAELMDWRRVQPERSAPSAPTTSWASARRTASGTPFGPARGWKETPAVSLDVGDRVTHDKYGLGTVVATDGVGPRATATIDFGTAGTIRLMLIGSVPIQKL
jgi:DNA helicase-2/ATP-dependent DNA helicase PcrA